MIRAKKLKKKLRRFSFLFACMVCVLAVLASGQILVFAWSSIIRPLLQPTSVVCVFNDIYSDKFVSEIKESVQAYATNRLIVSFDPKKFFYNLKKQFKCIKSLDYELQAPRVIKVTVHGVKPKMIVNNSSVLSEKRRLFFMQDFCKADISNLPSVKIDTRWCSKKLDEQVYNFLNKVNENILDRFSINYQGPNSILLVPVKQSQSYKIITDLNGFFDDKRLARIDIVIADLIAKEKISEQVLAKRECGLVFDIRFDNKVYVRFLNKSKRGAGR